MAKALTADQVVKLWAERGAGASESVKAGVNAVTDNPAAKAAAAVDLWAQRVAQAKQKFQDALNRVTLNDWKQAMLGKGLQNMQAGYNDPMTQRKFLNFMRTFLPYVREGAAMVKRMPKGTLQQGIDRAVAMIKHNAAFRGNQMGQAPFPRPVG